jgi:hypothetical protein
MGMPKRRPSLREGGDKCYDKGKSVNGKLSKRQKTAIQKITLGGVDSDGYDYQFFFHLQLFNRHSEVVKL